MGLAIRLVVPRHRAGVVVVCFDNRQRILMLRHVFHPGAPWGPPGGWLARGESPGECALRELKEETGLTADLGPMVYTSMESRPDQISIAFMASVRPGPIQLSSEIIEADWFQPEDLPQPLYSYVKMAIAAAVAENHKIFTSERQRYE